ncbi:MAG: PDZ domain-containing protein [Undibacterium sp.]|nr:PDZ domain-containing protein [Opitutaceae bacterium]
MKRLCLFIVAMISLTALRAAELPALWAERLKSVVAVEYFTETETDRRPSVAYGVVVDAQGTIILPSAAIDPRAVPSQLKEFKVYLPGDPASATAEYLGQDALTGWHFVRAEERLRAQLTPITKFASASATPEPALAEDVWGIGLRNKDEDFTPYLLKSHIALIQSLPQRTAIAQHEVAGPGLPVFNREGVFMGLAATSFGQTFLQFSRSERGGSPTMLINVEESSAFQVAEEVLPYLGRVPKNAFGRPLAWLGAYGFEPMDREVAKFLKLESQSGAVVSEVLEGSPAEKAGMQARDIVLAINGQPLPRFKPDRVVVSYVEREVERRAPGDTLTLTVLRGAERVDLKATLGDEPKLMREAARKYYERLGFTAREFVYGDAVARRVKVAEGSGVVAHFVKPNSPAAIAGLRTDDWIKEIDGVETKSFEAATEKLAATEADTLRSEFVLLVSRGGETAVLRVKLK